MEAQTLMEIGRLKRTLPKGGPEFNIAAVTASLESLGAAILPLCSSEDPEIRRLCRDIARREGLVARQPPRGGPSAPAAAAGQEGPLALEEAIRALDRLIFEGAPEGPVKAAFLDRLSKIPSAEALRSCLKKSAGGILVMCGRARGEEILRAANRIVARAR